MFFIRNLLCILPVITQAQITINIASEPTNVNATGQFEAILTDEHKELFHITDRLLKNAILNLTGQIGDVYLQEPFGNVYGNYNLEPVKTVLKPNRTNINVKRKEVFLNKMQAFNSDDYEKSQIISLAGYIEDNFTCFWKQNDVFPGKILYDINVIGLGEDPNWKIKSRFGRNVYKTQSVPTSASFSVNLSPNRDVTAILSATKVSLAIELFYTVTLTGHVLTRFENNDLWSYENYDIKTVMAAASMPHVILLSEEITLDYYENCFVKVFGDDFSPISTKNGNQCTFTKVDVAKNETSNLSRAQKISTENFIDVKKSAQGNSAVKNSGISLLTLITCLFLKIQLF